METKHNESVENRFEEETWFVAYYYDYDEWWNKVVFTYDYVHWLENQIK